jgi:hypothetical protein
MTILLTGADFLFNGQQGSPYRPEQARDPLSDNCWRPWHELNRERAGQPLGC